MVNKTSSERSCFRIHFYQ